jgi:hypothetical protein
MSVVALPLDSAIILGGLIIFAAGLIFGGLVGFIIGRA